MVYRPCLKASCLYTIELNYLMKKYCLSVLWIFLMVCANFAYAGWPIGKYRHILTTSATIYTSSSYWDKNTVKTTPENNSFTSYSFAINYGLGISRRADVYISVPFSIQQNKSGNDIVRTNGLGDATVGIAYNLAAFKYKRFLSVQASGILPLYNVDATSSPLGYGTSGAEIKLMYSGELVGVTYFNLEGGYRRYWDDKGPNQAVYTVTVGSPLGVRKKNQISFDISGITSYSANKNLVSYNPNLIYDGYFVKGSANFGHRFTNKFYLFLNGFYTIAGRNAPVGKGGAIFGVFKF